MSAEETDRIVTNLIQKMHKGIVGKDGACICKPPKALADDTYADMLTPALLQEDRDGKLTARLMEQRRQEALIDMTKMLAQANGIEKAVLNQLLPGADQFFLRY